MQECGVSVDPSTIFRRVQRYAPEIEKRIRQYQGSRSGSWRVDETYVRIRGRWKYLFRAVDKHGQFIASMLSDRRDTGAAYRFLRKALKAMGDYPLSSITTDKLASYPRAIQCLQREGHLRHELKHLKTALAQREPSPGDILEASDQGRAGLGSATAGPEPWPTS
jgi:transposase, IS6 family